MGGGCNEAVIFFGDQGVAKEMLYAEFEAVLDKVAGISEYQNTTMQAAYVRIDNQLQVSAAVFFLVHFDQLGYVEAAWNLPLAQLADRAKPGPNLGAGAIKLCCRSQCSLAWHQRDLWDPVFEDGANSLQQIAEAVRRNRLGLATIDAADLVAADEDHASTQDQAALQALRVQLKADLQQQFDERSSSQLAAHRLQLDSIKSHAQQRIEDRSVQFQASLADVNGSLESAKQLFSEEKHKNLQLKKTLAQTTSDFQHSHASLQQALHAAQNSNSDKHLELEQGFELAYKAKLELHTTELKERLDMREVELFYRDEQLSRLREEIDLHQQQKQQLLAHSGDDILSQLVDQGVSFVAYQPGSDHISIAHHDMARYLAAPIAFVAAKMSVDEPQYRQWLAHYEVPVCNHSLSSGELCAELVTRIETPVDFLAGETDRCAAHRQTPRQRADHAGDDKRSH